MKYFWSKQVSIGLPLGAYFYTATTNLNYVSKKHGKPQKHTKLRSAQNQNKNIKWEILKTQNIMRK